MPVNPAIDAFADAMTAIRRDLHAHPEIGFEEVRTSGVVAEALASYGVEVHRGIGKTGVVGVLRRGDGLTIGLRADMDALPMEERTNLPYRSTNPNRFHGCGHDGHTTMLLGAARHLASLDGLRGSVVFVFQPAEEGLGGARAMLGDGLFERFPCDEIYALHNSPYIPAGEVAVWAGPAMAGADFFDVTLRGRGAHGAMPQLSRDPVVAAGALIQALQTIVGRNANPLQALVLSITQAHAGSAYNVIPDEAKLAGTIRAFDDDLRAMARDRLKAVAEGVAQAMGVEAEVEVRDIFTVLENHAEPVGRVASAAARVVGEARVRTKAAPVMGSEDFADMLRAVPGAYFFLGQANDVPLHNPGYLFDDAILPIGASLLAGVVEERLGGG